MSKSSWRNGGLAVTLAFGLAACSDASGPANEDARGTYALQSINERALPYPIFSLLGYDIQYTSGTFTLAGDFSFRERAILTSRVDNQVVQVDTTDFVGRWQQSRATITLIYIDPPDTLLATLKNGLLSYDFSQDTAVFHYVYKKQ